MTDPVVMPREPPCLSACLITPKSKRYRQEPFLASSGQAIVMANRLAEKSVFGMKL